MSSLDSAVCTELLANRRRRDVLTVLRRMESEPVCVRVLVDVLLRADEPHAVSTDRQQPPGWQQSPDRQQPPGRGQQITRQRLIIELVHSHLPKLAAAGLIEYNPEALRVRYRAHPQVDALVDAVVAETQSASDQSIADRTVTTPVE